MAEEDTTKTAAKVRSKGKAKAKHRNVAKNKDAAKVLEDPMNKDAAKDGVVLEDPTNEDAAKDEVAMDDLKDVITKDAAKDGVAVDFLKDAMTKDTAEDNVAMDIDVTAKDGVAVDFLKEDAVEDIVAMDMDVLTKDDGIEEDAVAKKVVEDDTKVAESEEPSVKEINRIGIAVDGIDSKLADIDKEVEGMEKCLISVQGFLPKENVLEACRGLHKRCVTCSELLMQNTEKLDAVDIPASETMIRNRRKSAIKRIQLLLDKADKLEIRIDQCRTTLV